MLNMGQYTVVCQIRKCSLYKVLLQKRKLICYDGQKRRTRGAVMTEQYPFKWCHFEVEIILLCVRWYLRYALSYRDLEELMMERGLHVDHTTIYCIHLVPRLRERSATACPFS